MLDFSKETSLKFLRAAGTMLAARVLELEKELAQVKHEKKIDEDLLKVLTADLDLLRKKFFDSSSEKRPAVNGSKAKPGKDRLLHNHKLVDNNLLDSDSKLTQEEVIHTELSVTTFDEEGNGICGCGEGMFVPMSGAFEESSEIDVMDRVYIVRRHKRQQCKCTSCGKIIAAKGPLKLKPGAEFSVRMAVQVVDDKFHRHIPLNRQAEMMSERGLQVGTKTLYSLSEHLMELLKKIPSLICAEIHGRDHIHFHVVLESGSQQPGYRIGRLDQVIFSDWKGFEGTWQAYVAGPPPLVKSMAHRLPDMGIPPDGIFTDPFVFSQGSP